LPAKKKRIQDSSQPGGSGFRLTMEILFLVFHLSVSGKDIIHLLADFGPPLGKPNDFTSLDMMPGRIFYFQMQARIWK
jgi:hypothetical protein